jgi:hypothetical protein
VIYSWCLGKWYFFKHSKSKRVAGAGTQTAALAFGGNLPSVTGATEEYDGSTWTTNHH